MEIGVELGHLIEQTGTLKAVRSDSEGKSGGFWPRMGRAGPNDLW